MSDDLSGSSLVGYGAETYKTDGFFHPQAVRRISSLFIELTCGS